MFEKVNPSHPDKVADRIAGALVDLAYKKSDSPRVAIEVMIGHGICHVMAETSVHLPVTEIKPIVERIAGLNILLDYTEVQQDYHLADNQKNGIRCGDNGIFKGFPVTNEQRELLAYAKALYERYPDDGKYLYDEKKKRLVICQSNADTEELKKLYPNAEVNPLGNWTGGTSVDTGATNRKLGSDMGDGATGGGLHGKDLSKADVTLNIFAYLLAQTRKEPVELMCAIGDDKVDGVKYEDIVKIAREYIDGIGGFEKLAEWGLIRNTKVS